MTMRISKDKIDMDDKVLQKPVLKDYGETVVTANSSTSYTVDLTNGNVFNITMTGNCSFTFSNPPASGTAGSFTLYLKQDATGSRTATWPGAVTWLGGSEPTLSTAVGSVDVLVFYTLDGGTTWFGSLSGQFSTWLYRKSITISGSSGAGTDFQVPLSIGDSSGGDFHLGGNSADFPTTKDDGGDLKFTAADGVTELPFWVESVSGSVAKVWVKVSADLGTDKDIYVYYGNGNTTSASDGESTFLFFDDFEGTSLDTDKWDLNLGSVTVASSEITMGYRSAVVSDLAIYDLPNLKLRTRARLNGTGQYVRGHATFSNSVNANATPTDGWGMSIWSDFYDYVRIEEYGQTPPVEYTYTSGTSYHIYETRFTTSLVELFIDDSSVDSAIESPSLTDYSVMLTRCDVSDVLYDYVFAAKTLATEPSFNSVGSEEAL